VTKRSTLLVKYVRKQAKCFPRMSPAANVVKITALSYESSKVGWSVFCMFDATQCSGLGGSLGRKLRL
jgi:hypothetical protein